MIDERYDWPPEGWTEQTTASASGVWTRSVDVIRLSDGSYFADNARGHTDGVWGRGATPDEAVDDLVSAIASCAETFGGRRSAPHAPERGGAS